MDEFCGSPFWLQNLTWNVTNQPDFTPCFQDTVLFWIPCVFLWVFGPIEIISIYRSERRYIPVTILNLFKAFLTTVLCLLSVGELIEALTRPERGVPLVDFISPIVRSLAYVTAFGLIILHRNRGKHTSGLIFTFWLLMTVVSVINFRSLLRSQLLDHNTTTLADWQITELRFTLRIVATPLVIVQLFLSCIADKKAQDPFILTGEDYRSRLPEDDASILSFITFWWMNSLMWLGYRRALTQEDLYSVSPSERTEVVAHRFDQLLEPAIKQAVEEKRKEAATFTPGLGTSSKLLPSRNAPERSSWIPLMKKRPETQRRSENTERDEQQEDDENSRYVKLTRIIFRAYLWNIVAASTLKLSTSLLTFASPVLLSAIISFVTSNKEPDWRGILYAFTLFFLSLLESVLTNQEQVLTNLNVMRIRTAITSALYRKTLRLSNQGRQRYTVGEVVNFMAVDAQRIADLVQNVNSLWSAPLQLTISMVLLYQQLGPAIFAGLAVMLINIPFNSWIAVKLKEFQGIVMRQKDKRIKLLSEIFNGIKIIKIHAWEDAFRKRTEDIRANEIRSLNQQTWYSAAITFAFSCLPFIVALSSFATFVLIDERNVLDANKVFVSLSLFNIIRIPLAVLPMLITNLSQYIIAVKRINKFLEADEIDPSNIKPINDEVNTVKIQNGTFKWDSKREPALTNVNFEVPRRKLVAVVGSVGSGKSSLLSSILGDLVRIEGEVYVDQNSSLAYVPQEAWILNTSVKENILFNKVVNEDRYQKVLDACALIPDLKSLEYGDQSEIGEKGLNLSGGQKQRISLARAVYADTDIYLLDDPLNAVDAHVGRHIFDNIIGPKGMLRDRTRVLVTNKLSVLPEVDYIYVLKEGEISESGTYQQLLKDNGLFSQLLVNYLSENFGADISEGARMDVLTKELKRLEEQQNRESRETTPAQDTKKSREKSSGRGLEKSDNKHQSGRNLTGQEVAQVGSVGLDVHLNFARTMGLNFIIAVAIFILSSFFTIGSNFWLSDWSNDSLNETLRYDTTQRNIRVGVYGAIGVGESVCIIVSTILLNMACLQGSQILHNRMLARILSAPVSWFNVTPSGRIINRFSKDIDTVDVTIRFNVRLLLVVTLRSVTSLILISVGSVYSLILLVPIVLLYFLFQIFYVATSRQLKRVESVTKSPIYTHFTETITGTTSIRAYGVDQEFVLESNHRVDVNNSSVYIGFIASRWLAIRLEFLGFIVVLTTSLIAVLSRGSISPGIAGLSVTYSLTVTNVLSFLVRTYSNYETNVVSVERLIEYTKTPIEPEDEEEPSDPNWPTRGEIVFDDYSTKYRPELDLVLRKFNLQVNSEEKVGLVGRTGAGKSSVTLSLFRILEATDGRIVIDDVDISHINLKVLRSRLSIIPQEPILFTGTIRQNVDPTESYTDEEIWRALEMAHLGNFLRTLPDGLSTEVSEGGSNFSVGQKQLFCLARTLLRKSKILVLDEATAAVDVETDSLIQKTIREEFKNSTILTIAHRLETIQDYDKIVVMEDGALAEQGSPSNLLKNPKSKFYDLAKEAGIAK